VLIAHPWTVPATPDPASRSIFYCTGDTCKLERQNDIADYIYKQKKMFAKEILETASSRKSL
jgi:hypothetical protein